MRWYWGTLLALALVVAVPIGGLWLWGRPRANITMPTAATSPAEVVRTYARAMNARDFSACKHMGVGDAGDPAADWSTLQGPQMLDLKIERVGRVMSGRQAAKQQDDRDLKGWDQVVEVQTSETLKNFDGTSDPEPGHAFSFELVRHDTSQPWRIYAAGEG